MNTQRSSENYVLIVGSSNMDLNIYSERFPKPGETVTGGTFKQFLGGKGANQAVASARSGCRTVFIGKIGIDDFGNRMISSLRKEGIVMDYVIRDSNEASGVAFILIDSSGENMISVAPGSNAHLNPEDIRDRSDIILNASVVVVQMEIPIETIRTVFNITSKGSCAKILNPAPLKPIPSDILKNIDIIIPNQGELYRLNEMLGFGSFNGESQENLTQAVKNIALQGIDSVITTLGSKGCLVYHNNTFTKIEYYKVKAVDTVGAGDCFNGVLASKLARGESVINAAKYATAAASIAVTRKGAQASMPYEQEIELRYVELK